MINKQQTRAAYAVAKALRRCAKVGLMGGVYDGNFCLWPTKIDHPADSGHRFFDVIREHGIILDSNDTGMTDLDGGAGV